MIWLCWYSSGLCVLIDIFWWQGSIEKGSQSVYLGTGPYQYYVNIDMISWYSIFRPIVKGQSVAQFYHNLTSADWQTSSVWSPRIISECYLCWGQLSLGPGDWMRCKVGYHQHIYELLDIVCMQYHREAEYRVKVTGPNTEPWGTS